MVKERGLKAMGKEEEVTKEVVQLLERIKRELMPKEQEITKMTDPFKDLLHFIESPSDIDDENKVVEVSDEDNYQCSQCKITFEKSTNLSFHMKKVHKGIAKETQKKDTERAKEKETEDKKEMEASSMEDGWAEMPGGLYQCLVCLASGLTWERRQLLFASLPSPTHLHQPHPDLIRTKHCHLEQNKCHTQTLIGKKILLSNSVIMVQFCQWHFQSRPL